jgi:hypothetical protein
LVLVSMVLMVSKGFVSCRCCCSLNSSLDATLYRVELVGR